MVRTISASFSNHLKIYNICMYDINLCTKFSAKGIFAIVVGVLIQKIGFIWKLFCPFSNKWIIYNIQIGWKKHLQHTKNKKSSYTSCTVFLFHNIIFNHSIYNSLHHMFSLCTISTFILFFDVIIEFLQNLPQLYFL